MVSHPSSGPGKTETNFLLFFPFFLLIVYLLKEGAGIERPEETMKNYRRQWRELSTQHKEAISRATKNKHKDPEWREHISQAMIDYWRGVPHKPASGENVTMDEYLGKTK